MFPSLVKPKWIQTGPNRVGYESQFESALYHPSCFMIDTLTKQDGHSSDTLW